MKSSKKRLEVLFKSNFQIDKTSETEIKNFLENKIPGLSIKNIETYSSKSNVKAVIISNIMDILGNNDEESDIGDYRRGKSVSLIGVAPNFGDNSVILEEKDREIADLGMKLSKVTKELSDEKEKTKKLTESNGTKNEIQEISAMYQVEIKNLTDQLEFVDIERGKLEDKNRELSRQLEIMSLKHGNKSKTKIIPTGLFHDDASIQTEEDYESALKEFAKLKEEKQSLENHLASVTLKIMAEQEKVEKIMVKANMANTLKREVENLENEKENLKKI